MPSGGTVNYVDFEQTVTPDTNEPNNTRLQATVLGSPASTLVANQSIHSSMDEDWFKITANQSGVMQVIVHHMHGAGMDLELSIFDADGDLVAEVDTPDDDEFLAIPVVRQKTYLFFPSLAGAAGASG